MAKKMIEISAREHAKLQRQLRKHEEQKLKAAEKKAKAALNRKVDGLSAKDIDKLVRAIRQVWSWSTPRKLCIARATGKDGFPICEGCKKKVPKVYPDHMKPVGLLVSDEAGGYLQRMFTPSKNLKALCKKCHAKKTREDNAKIKRDKEAALDFY